jgi:biopolymer transport protein ExbB
MKRLGFDRDMGATAQRLVAVLGVSAFLALGIHSAMAQAPAQPTVSQPAGAVGPADQPPPPPPQLGPDGLPVAPPAGAAPADGQPGTDPAAAIDPAAAPAAAPAAEAPPADGALRSYGPVEMFLQAHVVVKAVMVWLILASILTWSLLFSKLTFFSGLTGRTDKIVREFRNSRTVQDAAGHLSKSNSSTPLGQMLIAAADELKASGSPSNGEKREHLTSRIAARMAIAQAEGNQELGSGMQIFATVGSISPFVGLFGTVWGIMNSFIGIAQTQTTNLAVVAPGIAEALFATAIGLFAAIPSVIFYNIFARRIGTFNTRAENFSGEVLVRLSRQLDQGA